MLLSHLPPQIHKCQRRLPCCFNNCWNIIVIHTGMDPWKFFILQNVCKLLIRNYLLEHLSLSKHPHSARGVEWSRLHPETSLAPWHGSISCRASFRRGGSFLLLSSFVPMIFWSLCMELMEFMHLHNNHVDICQLQHVNKHQETSMEHKNCFFPECTSKQKVLMFLAVFKAIFGFLDVPC